METAQLKIVSTNTDGFRDLIGREYFEDLTNVVSKIMPQASFSEGKNPAFVNGGTNPYLQESILTLPILREIRGIYFLGGVLDLNTGWLCFGSQDLQNLVYPIVNLYDDLREFIPTVDIDSFVHNLEDMKLEKMRDKSFTKGKNSGQLLKFDNFIKFLAKDIVNSNGTSRNTKYSITKRLLYEINPNTKVKLAGSLTQEEIEENLKIVITRDLQVFGIVADTLRKVLFELNMYANKDEESIHRNNKNEIYRNYVSEDKEGIIKAPYILKIPQWIEDCHFLGGVSIVVARYYAKYKENPTDENRIDYIDKVKRTIKARGAFLDSCNYFVDSSYLIGNNEKESKISTSEQLFFNLKDVLQAGKHDEYVEIYNLFLSDDDTIKKQIKKTSIKDVLNKGFLSQTIKQKLFTKPRATFTPAIDLNWVSDVTVENEVIKPNRLLFNLLHRVLSFI